jgi:hypothetical protein
MARCYRIVDLGTQKTTFNGELKHQHKIMLQFEVHGEDDKGAPLVTPKGEPMSISKNYTLSLAEKATLRIDLQTWRGVAFTPDQLRGFELKNILGHWAMLSVAKSVGNNNKEYTNIMSVNPVPQAIKKGGLPEGVNKLAMFTIMDPDMELFETFSNNLQAKIKAAPEWESNEKRAAKSGESGFGDLDDDLPF